VKAALPTRSRPDAPAAKGKIRIVHIDDHPFVRRAMRELLESEPDLAVCGESEGAQDAGRIIADTRPNLVLLDLSLGSGDGLSLLKALRNRHADLPILVVSLHSAALFAERALRAGANGYLMKCDAATDLIEAVRAVLAGHIFVSSGIREMIFSRVRGQMGNGPSPALEHLSDRELEVLQLIGQGLGVSDIAHRLAVNVKTVETHRAHIKAKLGIQRNPHLAATARQWLQEQPLPPND
jgi:DNA-binding NarL/FixJ family response regulator